MQEAWLQRTSHDDWKAKFGGMKVSDAQRLKAPEAENGEVKRWMANDG